MTEQEIESRDWPHLRQFVRAPLGRGLIFKSQHGSHTSGMARDVSERGAYIATTARVSIGTQLVLFLPLAMHNRDSMCLVSGKVVRIGKGNETPGVGVEFIPPVSKLSQRLLQKYVAGRR